MNLVEFFRGGVGSHRCFPAARATRSQHPGQAPLAVGVLVLGEIKEGGQGCDGPRTDRPVPLSNSCWSRGELGFGLEQPPAWWSTRLERALIGAG